MYKALKQELRALEKCIKYELGEPWKNSENATAYVIPILRTGSRKCRYVMLDSLKESDYELKDTGSINKIEFKNKYRGPVFIRAGAILEGGTQTRGVMNSVIVGPGQSRILTTRCVYRSKGIQAGSPMIFTSSYVPEKVQRSFTSGTQCQTWAAISDFSLTFNRDTVESEISRHGTSKYKAEIVGLNCPEEELSASNEFLCSNVDIVESDDDLYSVTQDAYAALKESPCHSRQVGALIVDRDGIRAIELYDSKISWRALHQRVLEKYQTVLTNTASQSLFKLNMRAVKKELCTFIDDILSSSESTMEESTLFKTRKLKEVCGEYTVIKANQNHEFVHLIASRKVGKTNNDFYVPQIIDDDWTPYPERTDPYIGDTWKLRY